MKTLVDAAPTDTLLEHWLKRGAGRAGYGSVNRGGQVEGDACYLTAAYLIPGKVGWGQFQPYVRYQKFTRDVSSTDKTQADVRLNYLIKNHNPCCLK